MRRSFPRLVRIPASIAVRRHRRKLPTVPGFGNALHNGKYYYLSEIGIYKDGMIDCWGVVSVDEFKRRVRAGKIVTQLPEGASVGIAVGISLTATDVQSYVEEEEFIKEVEDVI